MSYYKKHLFFCTNQRPSGKQCCQNANASDYCAYAKHKIKEKGLKCPGGIRVSSSGCLGRCSVGPVLVIYPEAVWYTYHSLEDVDEIITEHIEHGRLVKRLQIDQLDDIEPYNR